MPAKQSQSKAKDVKKQVTFSFEANAGQVMLAGDFTDWDADAKPMKNDGQGKWKKTVKLEPGRHEYKFLVDGQWVLDPKNQEICQNEFGAQNNVKVV